MTQEAKHPGHVEWLLTVEQAATRLQRSPNTIRKMARDGRLPHITLGKRIFILEASAADRYPGPTLSAEPKASLWARIRGWFRQTNTASAYPEPIDTRR